MRDSIAKVGWLPARTWNAPGLEAGIGSQRRIYLQYRQIHTFGKRKMPIFGETDVKERAGPKSGLPDFGTLRCRNRQQPISIPRSRPAPVSRPCVMLP